MDLIKKRIWILKVQFAIWQLAMEEVGKWQLALLRFLHAMLSYSFGRAKRLAEVKNAGN